jgi:hypothetical protein
VKIRIDNFWLAGAPDDPWHSQVANFRINGVRVVQVAQYLRAEAVKVFNRKNRQTTVTFEISRKHKTVQDAEVFILEHGNNIPGQGLVTFQALSSTGLVTERYLEAAVISGDDCSYIGATTRHNYQIVGGVMQKFRTFSL